MRDCRVVFASVDVRQYQKINIILSKLSWAPAVSVPAVVLGMTPTPALGHA